MSSALVGEPQTKSARSRTLAKTPSSTNGESPASLLEISSGGRASWERIFSPFATAVLYFPTTQRTSPLSSHKTNPENFGELLTPRHLSERSSRCAKPRRRPLNPTRWKAHSRSAGRPRMELPETARRIHLLPLAFLLDPQRLLS